MGKDIIPEDKFSKLRKQAGKKLERKPEDTEYLSHLSHEAKDRLIHELRAHQIELEMQNEEMRRTQLEITVVRDKYSDLYDFAPVGYFTISDKGMILAANLTSATMLGVERSSMIGKPFSRFIASATQGVYYFHCQKLIETKEKQTCELKLVKKDGSEFYTYLESGPVKDLQGDFNQLGISITDINDRKQAEEALQEAHDMLERRVEERIVELLKTNEQLEQEIQDRKQAEKMLRKNEERFRTTFNNAAIGMALMANNGCFMKVNHTLCRILGYSEEELLGKTWVEITSPDDLPGCYDWLKRIKAGAQSSYEKRFIHKLGHPVWIEVSSSLVRDSQGRIQYYVSLFQDIMSRKQTEDALRKREEKYRCIFENIQDVYYEVTLDGIILEASPSIEDVSLYKREEVIGKLLSDIYVDPKNRDEFLKELLKNGKVTDYEALLIDKNRSQVHCSITAKLIGDKQDNPVKIIGSLRNITERKRMEVSLRQSESQKRTILDASMDRIRYIDKDMKIIWSNKTSAKELNMSSQDSVGHTCYELFVGRDTPCKGCPTVIARETGKIERAFMYQPEVKGIEGESYWETHCVPLKNDAGEIESFILIARNITDQKHAEEQIHTLTQELMRAQESERQMISRELHDCVAQDLSSIKIGFETLFDNQPTIPREIRQKVSELSKMLRECIKEVRDLSYELRPLVLDELGLAQALFQYCNDFSENNGINIDFHFAGMKKLKLDFDTEINLYRLIQESLVNIKKHADAGHVTIKLVAAFPNIILRIKDDGRGFNVQKRLATLTKEKRMGIRSMEQRVKLLQGEMEIQSKPMQGTNISIKLPYKDKDSGSKEHYIDNRRPSSFQGRPQSDYQTQQKT
ncbi:MAG: hypothetical protein SRB2_00876 [Desulfobacteraceae bacterium Eth-SRB2]|nr:MAG: hypothetical protein SRB2_00876 [Desulfobacteraceae bacterium Eth-SRB2]